MPEISPDFPRAWVEFPDPDFDPEEDLAPGQVFRCDLTWLTSNYKCIFGDGCQGIYEDRPNDGCCTLGAHFTDKDDVRRVKENAKKLTPETWHKYSKDWTEHDEAGSLKTKVVDGACIFLNPPDFPAGGGCALHHLAFREGVSHVQTKPDVCWQLPIMRTYREVTRKDDTEYLEVSIGEYQRSGWGEGGHDLDWYCTSNSEAHVAVDPVYINSENELRELMGNPAYEELARLCEEHLSAPKPTFIHLSTKQAVLEGRVRR